VRGVAGTWKDLTDNVNFMAGNLTSQVRGIAKVVTAVARGNLTQKLTVEAKGEIAELADTINSMTATLATFADQVTTVAREVGAQGKLGGQASVPGASGTWKDLTDNVNQLAANLTSQVRAIADVATAVTKGDLTRAIQVDAHGEVASLKDNINEMIRNLKDTTLKNAEQDWLKTNLAKFSRMLQGQKDLLAVGRLILSELAPVVTAQYGAFYTYEAGREDGTQSEPRLRFLAGYAYTGDRGASFRLGEGLVGQCALEKQRIMLTSVPKDYLRIASGLGEAEAKNVMVLPVLFEGQTKAVMELASFAEFNPMHEVFLDQLTESVGIVFNTIEANMRTEDLLKQSQSLALELQSQQEELKLTNQELQEKAVLLAEQNAEVERKNQEVEHARKALEEKAEQLALTSKYKSEFLANMSHELRTPLNSLLILSDQLGRNPDGNLSPRQVEFAKTIHESGNDLLALINDILDLSKIESGTVTLDIGEVTFNEIRAFVERTFRHVAEAKGLPFHVRIDPDLPPALTTDVKRLQQVLKNLLSNAFKFTERGNVEIHVGLADASWNPDVESLSRARHVLAFSVIDTGIGIPPEKQQIIFEAFQQADGSTSRRYGGTGLGLAISREISRMLGGEIRLQSVAGEGSTFTLYLPSAYAPMKAVPRRTERPEPATAQEKPVMPAQQDLQPILLKEHVDDDRATIEKGDLSILIVDNDTAFAKFFLDLARAHGLKGIVTASGSAAATLAREYAPAAITLDIRLPDIDGWRVLAHLKDDLHTRHLPIWVISTDEEPERSLRGGAIDVISKPVTKEQLEHVLDSIEKHARRTTSRLLVVEDDPIQQRALEEWLAAEEIEIITASTGKDALELIKANGIDCVVADLGLPDVEGVPFIEQIRNEWRGLPIIVYTARDLTETESTKLKHLAESVVLKDVRSRERLLDAVFLHLHRPFEKMPERHQELIRQLHDPHVALAGRKVLVVDDDIRNIFAMTSVLERYDMVVLSAETGRNAIEMLNDDPAIDIVLMDIMMPGMDGHDTMRAIREIERFQTLPIIAVTAKAMKGDREKCIESGASDYLSKPVDPQQLVSMLEVWLHR
jgi:signal transduction histidine kinase/DNA-binding response OmpR family regulator/HAMP domain-containing protein